MYGNYLETISRRFEAAFAEMEAVYAFENGIEFELALCEALRNCLPQQYGVCRGYVVDRSGRTAGDDVIIYEQLSMPTLRPRSSSSYLNKEKIPIEAVYAYVEAKNSIYLSSSGKDGLQRALDQVSEVRALVETRAKVPLENIARGVTIGGPFRVTRDSGPAYRNPLFTAVLTKQVRRKSDKSIITDPLEIDSLLGSMTDLKTNGARPNFCGLGSTVAMITIPPEGRFQVASLSPLVEDPEAAFGILDSGGNTFGLFFCRLMEALGHIQLGEMPWREIFATGVNSADAERQGRK